MRRKSVLEHGLKYQGPLKPESTTPVCPDHPEAGWDNGFGYDGGGYGPYKKCRETDCGRVFAKQDIKDGND